eukprot:1764432-Amphidinium_carterae.2
MPIQLLPYLQQRLQPNVFIASFDKPREVGGLRLHIHLVTLTGITKPVSVYSYNIRIRKWMSRVQNKCLLGVCNLVNNIGQHSLEQHRDACNAAL